MVIDFDSHLREGYFMDEVYRLEGPYDKWQGVYKKLIVDRSQQ